MELDLQPIKLEGVSEERPLIIAGPCSAETEEQVMSTAKQLADNGVKIFRAGIWNPVPNREVSKESVWKDCPGSRKSRKKPACM